MYVHCIQNKYVAQKQKQKMHPVDASRRKPKNKNCALEKYSIKKQSASNIFLYILMEFDDFVYNMAPGCVHATQACIHLKRYCTRVVCLFLVRFAITDPLHVQFTLSIHREAMAKNKISGRKNTNKNGHRKRNRASNNKEYCTSAHSIQKSLQNSKNSFT